MPRSLTVTVVLGGAVLWSILAPAAEAPPPPPTKEPVILVLSGGGARGAAHIGVLKVMEELHIVPDLVVGTSMGSIIGGLYASGWSPDEIHELLLEIDWLKVFSDKVERNEESFRRKQDDRPYLIASRLHFDDEGFYLPPGILGGQSLELLLDSLDARTLPATDFDRLPIPYRAVAADFETGDAVVIGSGSVAKAMRASMAIPGMFAPVIRDGRTVCDGGSVANLPIGIAQSLKDGTVIAVDISSPLMNPNKKLKSFWDVFNQMNSLLTVGNREVDIKRLRPNDLYIRPELGDISFMSFDKATEAVAKGEAAARASLERLRPLAADDATWQAFIARHRSHPVKTVKVDRVRIDNATAMSEEMMRAAVDLAPGAEVPFAELNRNILRVYNLRHFGVISYRIVEEAGERVLVIDVPEPTYGPDTVQVGLSFFDDFEGETGYTITGRHQHLAANKLGGEWENVLQIGTRSVLSSEFYQPLSARGNWFVAPYLGLERSNQEVWHDGQPVAQYRVKRASGRLSGGYIIDNWGEIRLTPFYEDASGVPRIGVTAFPSEDVDRAGFDLGLHIDTEDTTRLATSGSRVVANYQRSENGLGSDVEFERVAVSATSAWTIAERTVVSGYVEYADNLKAPSTFFDLFYLGGPGRMSGLGTRELYGETLAYARLNVRQRLVGLDLASVRVRIFAGAMAEAGNTFNGGTGVDLDELLYGGTLYLAAETPAGPLYFGYGFTEGDRNRWYLSIGDRF